VHVFPVVHGQHTILWCTYLRSSMFSSCACNAWEKRRKKYCITILAWISFGSLFTGRLTERSAFLYRLNVKNVFMRLTVSLSKHFTAKQKPQWGVLMSTEIVFVLHDNWWIQRDIFLPSVRKNTNRRRKKLWLRNKNRIL